MSDSPSPDPEPIVPADPALAAEPPLAPPPPPPERYPFWSYQDLLMFIGFGVVSMIVSALVVKAVLTIFHLTVRNQLAEALPDQFLAYLCLFLLVAMMFRVQYDRPFWPSMGWSSFRSSAGSLIGSGVLLAIGVAAASRLLQTPDIPTPMSKLLADRTSVLLVAIFGMTVGPLCEELIFRGFLQPLLVRTFGPPLGILLAALPFGLMHLPEYGYSWRHGVLIMTAGTAFGWVRHRTASTRASTLVHAVYNGTFFLAMLTQWKNLPHG